MYLFCHLRGCVNVATKSKYSMYVYILIKSQSAYGARVRMRVYLCELE